MTLFSSCSSWSLRALRGWFSWSHSQRDPDFGTRDIFAIPHAQLRVRHRSRKMHRLSRLLHRLQGRARDPGRREPLLGQDRRKRHLPRHPPFLLPRPLQPMRRSAVREDLPDQRAVQAPRRHRRSARRLMHRLPGVHGGVPLRSAVHRSEHADGREVQLLREPRREQSAAGLRQRVPDRMPHLRRSRRSDERGRADRAARGHLASGSRRRGRSRRSSTSARTRASCSRRSPTRPFMYKEGQVLLRPLGSPTPDPLAARRAARRLRHAAREAVGPRHGPVPADQGDRDRRPAAHRDSVVARRSLRWSRVSRVRPSRSSSSPAPPCSSSSISSGRSASTTSSCVRTGDRGWSGARTS